MDYRSVVQATILLSVTVLAVAGCGDPNQIPAHSESEQKAIDKVKNMSPQQQIDMINNGPMPPAAKAAMIKKVKDKAGMP